MDVRPIRTEADYDWALAEVTRYFESEPARGSPDGDRFEVLLTLLEVYENRLFSIEAPDPAEAIAYWMELRGKSQADLAELLGSRSRASEILARKRSLSLDMISRLHEAWGVPVEFLLPARKDRAA